MLMEIGINLVCLVAGAVVGYAVLPVFFRHNPSLTPASISAHFATVGKDFGTQAPLIIEAHAKAAIATIKAEALKLGVTIP